jgi:thiosulfate reductase cytochrome b subunit
MSAPAGSGRPPRRRWRRLLWFAPIAIVVVVVVILGAQGLRATEPVQHFLRDFPGRTPLPAAAPVGLPVWLNALHALNALFLLLIVRSGWQVRTTTKPPAYWTRSNTGRFRTRNAPKRISIHLWLHLALDILWILNGIVFLVLLFATGQWMRIVPTSWDVVPNALSAALQYASMNWPTEDGWVNYNSLQLLSYFAIVFVAAPLAILTGVRMSGFWPRDATRLNRIYPIQVARAVHFPVMLVFVAFVIVHVVLVLATGALRNLGHMYASQDATTWTGAAIFAGTVVIMAAAWIAARPILLRPIAALTGKVGR